MHLQAKVCMESALLNHISDDASRDSIPALDGAWVLHVQARERVRAMEEEEAEPSTARDEDILRVDERARDAWDCESVLSMRSTQYNHPTRLDAGARSRCGPLMSRTNGTAASWTCPYSTRAHSCGGSQEDGGTACSYASCVSRRPREARQIQLSHKTGWPVKWNEVEAGTQDLAQQPAQASRPATAPPRKRDESVEDKKQRKEAVKDAKVCKHVL